MNVELEHKLTDDLAEIEHQLDTLVELIKKKEKEFSDFLPYNREFNPDIDFNGNRVEFRFVTAGQDIKVNTYLFTDDDKRFLIREIHKRMQNSLERYYFQRKELIQKRNDLYLSLYQ